jgi:hypothetical protein
MLTTRASNPDMFHRHNIPPLIKNLQDIDKIEEQSPKGGWLG